MSINQPCFDYVADENWTLTFESPISNLRLYCKYWRTIKANFNHPFTIISGSKLQNPKGNQLNTEMFSDGIIEFTEPISTLTIAIESSNGGYQAMTFGLDSETSIHQWNKNTEDIKAYPNPSSQDLEITGLTHAENYILYNIFGNIVDENILNDHGKINIRYLSNGLYFLKFNNRKMIKVIKE